MAKLFGTDGVRGKANVYPMVSEFALKLGQVAGKSLAQKYKKVAICRDTRVSGQMLESAMAAGFASVGVDVLLLGVLPTPAMAALAEGYNVDLAVVISASHNPYYDNGIKLMNGKGEKLLDKETLMLEEMIAKDVAVDAAQIGKIFLVDDAVEKYKNEVKKVLGSEGALKGLRVVLDCANGVLSEIMPEIFKDSGAGVIAIGNQPDGCNINKECGSTNTDLMVKTVLESKAHIGIAVDGDGDRIIVCDEKGQRIDGDQIIAYLAKELHESGRLKGNAVVATIVSNAGLGKFIKSLALDYYQTAVGERYVVEKMKEIGSNVGGEESGHMVLLDYAKGGDSLVVALVIAAGLLKSGKKMSDIFPVFEPMPKIRTDLKFSSKEEMLEVFEKESFNEIVLLAKEKIVGKGQVLVRKSGTEPKIQVWVWSEDAILLESLSNFIVEPLIGLGGEAKRV